MKPKVARSAIILALAVTNGLAVAETMPNFSGARDAKAGDENGDNQGNDRHVVRTERAVQAGSTGSGTS